MERRWTWQIKIVVAVVFLVSCALFGQAPATAPTAPLTARELAPILDTLQALQGSPIKFERTRIEQGYTQDIYTLLQNLRGVSAMLDLREESTPEARGKLHEYIDKLDQHFRALVARRETFSRNGDRDNLLRYGASNTTLPAPAAGERRVLFMGDSITDGWRLQEFFIGKPYVNRGISGQITGEMLGRMKADVLDLKPMVMVVLAGTNDLARGVTDAAIKNNLYMMGSLAKAAGIKVIFASILPVNDPQLTVRPPDRINELNKYLQELCSKEGYIYLDYFSALKDSQGLIPKALAADGLHPNADGYKIMAPLVEAAIEKALAASAPMPARKR